MPSINSDEIVTLRHKRNFIQFGGAKPGNALAYAGQDAQYFVIDGLSISEIGGIDPIFVADPRKVGTYRMVGRSFSPPDLPTASIKMKEMHGYIPRALTRIGCQFNAYEVTGNCKDLSDFVSGWTDYVMIYSGGIVTDKDGGTRSAWDSDDAIEDTLNVTFSSIYPVGSLSFGASASTQVDREVVDVVYGSIDSCGSCSNPDDGSKKIYAVTKSSGAGSPGLPAELIYTLDGGATVSQATITGFGATEDPVAIDIVGNYLVIIGSGAYFYAELSATTGAPGTFTKVSTGFVAAKNPNDMYVVSPREVYFAADGGYIYKSVDITTGVTPSSEAGATSNNLTRIHGKDSVIVAVGASGTIVKSANRGQTWATTTTTPTGRPLTAVCVVDPMTIWIGTQTDGRTYFTVSGGEIWSEKTFGGSGSGNVYDIVFPTADVGYIAYQSTTPTGFIYATINGGADWTKNAPRIANMPTYSKAGRLAFPDVDASIAANNLALAGIAGGGVDGILLIGIAGRM